MVSSISDLINYNRPKEHDINVREELWVDRVKVFEFLHEGENPWNKNYCFLPPFPLWKKVRETLLAKIPEEDQVEEIKKELIQFASQYKSVRLPDETEEDLAVKKRIKALERLEKIPNLLGWQFFLTTYSSFITDNLISINNKTVQELIEKWEEALKVIYKDYQKCRIKSFENNAIIIVTKNYRIDNDGKAIAHDLASPNLAILYQKRLYFITSARYIDPRSLIVEIKAQLDGIFSYYPNLLLSSGWATLEDSPIFKNSLQPCFSFCQYLDNEVTHDIPIPWQPRFSLWKINPLNPFDTMNWEVIKDSMGENFRIPTVISVQPFGEWDFKAWLDRQIGVDTYVFLAPEDYGKNKDQTIYSNWKEGEVELPEIFQEHPHLIKHSKIQFYFMATTAYEGEMNHLTIKTKKIMREGKEVIRYYFHYVVTIKAGLGGIFYIFQSGSHRFRFNIESHQVFKSQKLLQKLWEDWEAIRDFAVESYGKAKRIIKGFLTVGVSELSKDEKKEKLKELQVEIAKLTLVEKKKKMQLSIVDLWRQCGVKIELEQQENYANFEAQGARLTNTTTGGADSKTKKKKSKIELADFYANIMSLQFNLQMLASQHGNPMFQCRATFSNTLHNYLLNATNQSHSLDLPVKFRNFASVLRPGFNRGEVALSDDREVFPASNTLIKTSLRSRVGFMTNVYRKGFILKNEEEKLTNPQFQWRETVGRLSFYEINNLVYVGKEEVRRIPWTIHVPYDPDRRAYSHETYFRFTSLATQESFRTAAGSKWDHYEETAVGPFAYGRGFCWGCSHDKIPPSRDTITFGIPADSEIAHLLEKGITDPAQQKASETVIPKKLSRGSTCRLTTDKDNNTITIEGEEIVWVPGVGEGAPPMPTDDWQPSAWGGLDIPVQPMNLDDVVVNLGNDWQEPPEGIGSGGGLAEFLEEEKHEDEIQEEIADQQDEQHNQQEEDQGQDDQQQGDQREGHEE
jgi:hypothetical protein